jgi:lrp/asnC family transcriptional regulator
MYFSVRIKCQPGFVEAVAKQLCQIPEVMSVSEMTGEYQLQLLVIVSDKSRVRPVLNESVGQVDGVSELITSLMSDIQLEGAQWNSGTLGRIENSTNYYNPPEAQLDECVKSTFRVLECDGRADASRIALSLGLGAPQARRIVRQFLSQRVLIQRVEAAPLRDEWPGALALWLLVPPTKLDKAFAKVKTFPGARLCTTLVGGEANLYVVLWLRSFSQASEVEADVIRGLPTRVVSRGILLQHHKRMGVLLNEEGRKMGHVPWEDSSSPRTHFLHAC